MRIVSSPLFRWPLTIIISMVAGLLLGKALWHRPAELLSGAIPSSAAPKRNLPPEARTPTEAAGIPADEVQRIQSMTPDEFGVFMADAWMTPGDATAMLRKAFCVANCDTKRAMAFYSEYKKRKGLTPGDDAGELREFITIVGKKEGRAFMEAMLKLSPQGTGELDSLIHGWASVDSAESVEWMNRLPDESPVYRQVLKGLLWGLAQNSPSVAAQVFQQLGPEDRNKDSIYCVGDGTVFYHGLRGLNSLLPQIPDPEERRRILEAAGTGHGMGAAPADYVKEMAAHVLPENPGVSAGFRNMAQRWVKTAPANAMAWWKGAASAQGQENATLTMASQLKMAGLASEMKQWLQEHPTVPARQSLESILNQKP